MRTESGERERRTKSGEWSRLALLFSALRSAKSLIALLLLMGSCHNSEPTSCFDRALYEAHKDDICTMDCPGVRGCDGRTYCNECIANAQGIKVEDD